MGEGETLFILRIRSIDEHGSVAVPSKNTRTEWAIGETYGIRCTLPLEPRFSRT